MKCRSCGSTNIKDILSLGDQYLSDFVNPGDPKPPKYPLNLVLCKDCTLLQLRETTPSSELYTPRYGYRSGINNTIKADLQDIAEKALKYHSSGIAIDIGCNDGTLLSNYPPTITKVGFEPISKFATMALSHGDTIINNFFDKSHYPLIGKAKIITAISMFYDLEDPNTFVQDIADLLDDDGICIIQQNYLVNMMKNTAFDNIVHEHIEYYTLTSLEPLLNRHGLGIVDVETNLINGGSFRVYVKHMDRLLQMRRDEEKLKLSSQYSYLLFDMAIKNVKQNLHSLIKGLVDSGKTVYVLGASTRGNTLLQYCGLDHTLITASMERNPEKWGKVIASVGIPIVSEEEARKVHPDYMLCLPWFFKSELIKREEDYLKSGGHLIFPLPKVEVI
jgi:hypothetical protein